MDQISAKLLEDLDEPFEDPPKTTEADQNNTDDESIAPQADGGITDKKKVLYYLFKMKKSQANNFRLQEEQPVKKPLFSFLEPDETPTTNKYSSAAIMARVKKTNVDLGLSWDDRDRHNAWVQKMTNILQEKNKKSNQKTPEKAPVQLPTPEKSPEPVPQPIPEQYSVPTPTLSPNLQLPDCDLGNN